MVRSTLYSAFGIRKLATVYTPSNDYAVLIETDRAQQLDPAVLSKVYVRSNTGQQVPLSAVTRVNLVPGPVSVARQSQLPAVTITFNAGSTAVPQKVPVTLWASSGSRVHSVTFYVNVSAN